MTAKVHLYRICVTDFIEGGGRFCPPPIREQSQKLPSYRGLRKIQKLLTDLLHRTCDPMLIILCFDLILYYALSHGGYNSKILIA